MHFRWNCHAMLPDDGCFFFTDHGPMDTRVRIKGWLRAVLEANNWTPEKWAKLAGIAPTTITRFLNDETGQAPMMSNMTISKLEAVAGVQPLWPRGCERAAPALPGLHGVPYGSMKGSPGQNQTEPEILARYEEAFASIMEALKTLHEEEKVPVSLRHLVCVTFAECSDVFADNPPSALSDDTLEAIVRTIVSRQRRSLRKRRVEIPQ